MAISKIGGVALLILAVAVANTVPTLGEEAPDCSQVEATLKPCVPYLEAGGKPTEVCCEGLKKLELSLPTTVDRRAACECIKAAAAKYPSSIDVNAAQLPDKCNAPIGFPVSRSVDCNSVN